jgi:plasmid maintenance system antidote protein VapI
MSETYGKLRILVTEDNYRDIEDKFGIKVDHLIRLKNKADLENTILKKEIERLQEIQALA